MDGAVAHDDSRRVTRRTVLGYLIALLGVAFGLDAGTTVLADGMTARAALDIGAALLVVVAGVLVCLDPYARIGRTEPASVPMYLLAVLATLSVIGWLVGLVPP